MGQSGIPLQISNDLNKSRRNLKVYKQVSKLESKVLLMFASNNLVSRSIKSVRMNCTVV